VAAIIEATIRVLAEQGNALTTTRVAEVAGVSVGTLYQYFPNRDALINAVLADHLEAAICAVETTAEAARDLPLALAVDRVVRAFLAAKAKRAQVTALLHRVFDLLDERPIVQAATRRAERAVAALLPGNDLQLAQALCTALEGVVRAAILEDPDRLLDPEWVERVVALAGGAVARL
jgi:AcrR family transcriptional regulator